MAQQAGKYNIVMTCSGKGGVSKPKSVIIQVAQPLSPEAAELFVPSLVVWPPGEDSKGWESYLSVQSFTITYRNISSTTELYLFFPVAASYTVKKRKACHSPNSTEQGEYIIFL